MNEIKLPDRELDPIGNSRIVDHDHKNRIFGPDRAVFRSDRETDRKTDRKFQDRDQDQDLQVRSENRSGRSGRSGSAPGS